MVKSQGLTLDLPLILDFLSMEEGDGIPGVAVECVDIRRNTDSEGSRLGQY